MIDFHCHLDLYPDPAAVLGECDARGIQVLSVTTTPSAWRGTSALARNRGCVRTALGLHPQLVAERHSEISLFESLVGDTAYVGEIGLDGAVEGRAQWDDQVRVFGHILGLCEMAGGRIMSIHSRRAAGPVLQHLKEHAGAGTPVLHWFSGTATELDRAVELGCWFSVGPAMLRGQRGRALLARMPRDRVLTESDGPFAQLGGRSAMPWDVEGAVQQICRAWNQDPQEAQRRLDENLLSLTELASAS
jgi:TatD DNase family protein